ncbi:peptide-methionine (S)-S-oxide reductase MsrA [Clostridium sp. DL1XJH146]
MKKIVFAGGCFWGVQAYFDNLDGVINTKVGYANGKDENPTYEKVCNEDTGFAEAVYIEFDEKILDLNILLDAYWKIVDPTIKDRQGHDIGNQYRTGIYYIDQEDYNVIISSKNHEQKKYDNVIVTEIEELRNFYDGEEYHQKYLDKNPNGYCHISKSLLKK